MGIAMERSPSKIAVKYHLMPPGCLNELNTIENWEMVHSAVSPKAKASMLAVLKDRW